MREPAPDVRLHPAHYQLGYGLAAHQTHVLLVEEARAAVKLTLPDLERDAPKRAHALLVDAATALAHDPPDELAVFLVATVEPSAAFLLAGLRLIVGTEEWVQGQPTMAPKAADDDAEPTLAALRHLVVREPRVALLHRFALHPERSLSPRAHYTGACFFATLGDRGPAAVRENAFDLSLYELARALVGEAGPAARARSAAVRNDPSLAPLLADADRKEQVEALLAAFVDPPPPPARDSFDED